MRAYDPVTRIMTLDDGAKFLHLTHAQAMQMVEWKPNCRVWTTMASYVEAKDTDLYEGRRFWEGAASTFYSRRDEIEADNERAWCVPLEEYNHPDWGEYTP